MDEIKLENWQKHDTQALLDKHMAKIIDGIRGIVGNVSDQQLYKIIVNHTRETLRITKEDAIRSDIQLYYPNLNTKSIINALINTVQVYNVAGLVLRYKYTPQVLNLYLIAMYNNYQRMTKYQRKDCTLFEQLYNRGFFVIFMNTAEIMKPNKRRGYLLYNYMHTFKSLQQFKEDMQGLVKYRFNRVKIDQYYQKSKMQINISEKQQKICQLYEQYINNGLCVYQCYEMINFIKTITDRQFIYEFYQNGKNYIEQLVSVFGKMMISSLDELITKTKILTHLKYGYMYIQFTNSFKLQDISDDIIIQMLFNIENRLQDIYGCCGSKFILIRRVSDNRIYKSMITNDTQSYINDLIDQMNDMQLYDVIILRYDNFINISNIRIRYLNCHNNLNNEIKIELNHPKDLISASLQNIKIININQCINLRNLHSLNNTYSKEDIMNLTNIAMIYSANDSYDNNGSCFIEDLLKNNKLEYIQVWNKKDSNIVRDMTISNNISQLQVIQIYQEKAKYNIIIDITNEKPKNLCVFNIQTNGKQNMNSYDDIRYGILQYQGSEKKKRQLFNEINNNLIPNK